MRIRTYSPESSDSPSVMIVEQEQAIDRETVIRDAGSEIKRYRQLRSLYLFFALAINQGFFTSRPFEAWGRKIGRERIGNDRRTSFDREKGNYMEVDRRGIACDDNFRLDLVCVCETRENANAGIA